MDTDEAKGFLSRYEDLLHYNNWGILTSAEEDEFKEKYQTLLDFIIKYL